jgi:hypothetical protein
MVIRPIAALCALLLFSPVAAAEAPKVVKSAEDRVCTTQNGKLHCVPKKDRNRPKDMAAQYPKAGKVGGPTEEKDKAGDGNTGTAAEGDAPGTD